MGDDQARNPGLRLIEKSLYTIAKRPRDEWTLEDCVYAADYLMRNYLRDIRGASPEVQTMNLWFALSAVGDIAGKAAELGGDVLPFDRWRELLGEFMAPENRRDTSGTKN